MTGIEEQLEEFHAKIVASKHTAAMLDGAQYAPSDEADGLFWVMCYWPVQVGTQRVAGGRVSTAGAFVLVRV